MGRIRNLDVMLELAIATVRRLPAAAVPLQNLMVELRASRDARLRRAVKRLEREDNRAKLAPLRSGRRAMCGPLPAERRHGAPYSPIGSSDGRTSSRERLPERAVFIFPNRVHAVRVAAKKLRYALEAAEATGTVRVSGALALLKRVQDVLGDLHDRHVFLQAVAERASQAAPEHVAAFDAVRAYLEAGCRDLHGRYLEERDDLIELCGTARAAVRPRRLGFLAAAGGSIALAAAGALAVRPAVRLLRRAG